MADSTSTELSDATSAWCVRAEQVSKRSGGDCDDCLAVVRDGILLRRQWDRLDRDAPQRRRLLTLLADAQVVCHRRLAESIEDPAAADPQRTNRLVRRLAISSEQYDDAYLAELLADHTLPAETLAFAVECFRDDLHWLGTLAALADGSQGIDFIGRVLLEQESLQRTIGSWGNGHREPGMASTESQQLHESARQLRTTALARQAEALLARPEPDDLQGWYRAWQAASRLAMRPKGATHAELERAVQEYRAGAIDRWSRHLAQTPAESQAEALRAAADDLADAAGESLTFMEDLPPAEAIRALEILAEDAATCARVMRKHGSSSPRGLRRRVRRRRKAIAGELMERRLGWRMERLFGYRAVAAMERTILLLLVMFVVMLAVEGSLSRWEKSHWPGSYVVETTCAWLDLGICLVFLTEFSLKFSLASPRGLYFGRNWITGLVPAIPVGFIAFIVRPGHLDVEVAGEAFVLLRGLRYLRLPQMVRWLRFAQPALRVMRLVVFVMAASDRLVRRFAPLLNHNLVLFQQAAIEVEQPAHRTALATLRERFRHRAAEVIGELSSPAQCRLVQARIEDLTAMLSAREMGPVTTVAKAEVSSTREIPLEAAIAGLLAATPASVSDRVGRTLARSVARWCRAFDVFAVRRLPVIRGLVAAGRNRSPYGTTAQVANQFGLLLKHLLDRMYWVADLYGTLTAPQLVDSVGEWLVKGTARPARRLLILGVAFLAVTSLAGLFPFPDVVKDVSGSLERMIGAPLVIFGLLCLVPLFVGLWFRQIAGEATDFCTQVGEAQFLTATKQLKRRFARRHHALLHQRVIAPELELRGGGQVSDARHPTPATASPQERQRESEPDPTDPTQAAVELLFEDYLDGAPFHHTDTKTTTQLLGNLTLISLRETRLGYGRRGRKRLRRLDLTNSRSWLRGPYLWFQCISRSLAQQTAKLVVDYNAHALPLERAAVAGDEQVRRYVDWLGRRLNRPIDRLNLAPEFRDRLQSLTEAADDSQRPQKRRRRRGFQGSDFTAIHFLSDDPRLQADICRRYGEAVAELMHRDRRDNVRRVFRTYPFHHWPKRQRTVNPLAIHSRYLRGGRVLLLPPRMLWWGAVLALRAARLLARFVRDVLQPTVGDLDAVSEPDPLAVAVRKIHRMRKPVFLECLRMRARFDPEYLGISLPGCVLPGEGAYVRRTTTTPIEEDLARINADPGVRQEFRLLTGRRRREMLEFRRLLAEFDWRRRPAESLRAMAIAYSIDYEHVRSRPEATRRLRRAFDEVLGSRASPEAAGQHSRRSIRALWCRLRYRKRLDSLFRQPAFADLDAVQRETCRRLICRRRGPVLKDLRQLTGRYIPADPLGDAKETLSAIARDPATWSRQLVILRAVQTLTVLDIITYCELVKQLGEYGTHTAESPSSH